MVSAYDLRAGEVEKRAYTGRGSLDSQFSRTVKIQIHERPCLKNKTEELEDT